MVIQISGNKNVLLIYVAIDSQTKQYERTILPRLALCQREDLIEEGNSEGNEMLAAAVQTAAQKSRFEQNNYWLHRTGLVCEHEGNAQARDN